MRLFTRSSTSLPAAALALVVASPFVAPGDTLPRGSARLAAPMAASGRAPACAPDNGGLTLPDGFCASRIADDLGAVRHIAVSPAGDLYAAVSGRMLSDGVIAFRDKDGDGLPDERAKFGPSGANDLAVHEGYLYAAYQDQVIRWKLAQGKLEPDGRAETIVKELPDAGNHKAKTLAFPGGSMMLVKIGSATNSCQESDRRARSPGKDPCKELERHAGLWRFDAGRAGQTFADGRRWATGMRNAEALTVQPGTGQVWAAIHGRDQLGDNWGFSDEANANNPAEELVQVNEGDDFGWPYCYYSNTEQKKVLAPEYGGDGKKVGRCDKAKAPVIAFPGHWAPMALQFYTGAQFGSAYEGGLFITFHGSWNRAPLPQEGFRVVFAPFENGKPTGKYETFATMKGQAFRPVGLAVGKNGALFVAADDNGAIWRIVHR